ncbi:MAG TPA: hypothetical protein ENG32_00305 [bacterium]|nr:hypothetical protein [bacterium]
MKLARLMKMNEKILKKLINLYQDEDVPDELMSLWIERWLEDEDWDEWKEGDLLRKNEQEN